jgi:FMN reductase
MTVQDARTPVRRVAGAAALRPVVALVGNPRPASRTAAVARAVQARLAAGNGSAADVLVDLGAGAPDDEALAAVLGARTLVVASPTYRGSYTGLLKTFADVLPPQALAGVVAVPVMTAAAPAHRHAVESYLRPLLLELGATVPVPGLSVLESELDGLDERLDDWSRWALPVLVAAAGAGR